MAEQKYFHTLESEEEFDRFMAVTVSTIGTALAQDENRPRDQVEEMATLTGQNIMFLCQEYCGLVADGKMKPVERPKDMTQEQAREEVMKQLKTVEAFFTTAGLKQKEEKQNEQRDKN